MQYLRMHVVRIVKYILCMQVKNKPHDRDNGTCVYSWLTGLYDREQLRIHHIKVV